VSEFECAIDRLRASLLSKVPDSLRTYFEGRIVHFLQDNVTAGCHGWTNNSCDTLNHILKLSIQWRPNKLPDLIQKLQTVVNAQYIESDRALLGYGNYVLRPEYACHRLTPNDWSRKTAAQKAKTLDQCFRLPTRTNAMTSTHGMLTVNAPSNKGRKPHQRKRPAAEKTTSAAKRQR